MEDLVGKLPFSKLGIPEAFLSDFAFVQIALEMVSDKFAGVRLGFLLDQHVRAQVHENRDIAKMVVTSSPGFVAALEPQWMEDRELLSIALHTDGRLLCFASPELQDDD